MNTKDINELTLFLSHFIGMIKLKKGNEFKILSAWIILKIDFNGGKASMLVIDEISTLVKGYLYNQIVCTLRGLAQ